VSAHTRSVPRRTPRHRAAFDRRKSSTRTAQKH
jgi:hypothetical protein